MCAETQTGTFLARKFRQFCERIGLVDDGVLQNFSVRKMRFVILSQRLGGTRTQLQISVNRLERKKTKQKNACALKMQDKMCPRVPLLSHFPQRRFRSRSLRMIVNEFNANEIFVDDAEETETEGRETQQSKKKLQRTLQKFRIVNEFNAN